MKEIKISRRTQEEKAAYLQGLAAGLRMGEQKKPMAVLQVKQFLSRDDMERLRTELQNQNEIRVLLLSPGIQFCGTIPEDRSIESVVDLIEED